MGRTEKPAFPFPPVSRTEHELNTVLTRMPRRKPPFIKKIPVKPLYAVRRPKVRSSQVPSGIHAAARPHSSRSCLFRADGTISKLAEERPGEKVFYGLFFSTCRCGSWFGGFTFSFMLISSYSHIYVMQLQKVRFTHATKNVSRNPARLP
jgi:hypothetical protein